MASRILSDTKVRLGILFLVSLLVHTGYVLSPIGRMNAFPTDDYIYLELGRNLITCLNLVHDTNIFYIVGGHEPTMFWTPVYPFFIALLLLCKTNPLITASLIQAFLMSLMVFPVYGIAKVFFTGRPVWWVALLWALYPLHLLLSYQIASENIAVVLTILATWLCLRRPQTLGRALMLGLCLGVLSLTRPEFLLFSVIVLLWNLFQKHENVKNHLVRSACILFVFATVIFPWLARNHALCGRTVFTTRGAYSLVYENELWYLSHGKTAVQNDGFFENLPYRPREIQRYDYLMNRGVSYIKSHPARYAAMCVKRMVSFSLPSTLTSLFYRVFSAKDIKGMRLPPLWEVSNCFFTFFLWIIVFPGLLKLFLRKRYTLDFFRGPQGLLLLTACGQLAVSVAVIYTTYQRSIIDMNWIVIGLSVFLCGRDSAEPNGGNARGRP